MPDGSVYIVRRPAAETHGELVEMEFVLPSRCVPPPPHVHPQQVEEYEVLDGRFDVVVEGEWRTLAAGESAAVPIWALHTFRNRSGGVARVRNWHRPAMRFEDFIERTCHTLQAAGVKRKRDPRVSLYLSMVMLDFEDTLGPGRRRERLPMQALARIARLLPIPGSLTRTGSCLGRSAAARRGAEPRLAALSHRGKGSGAAEFPPGYRNARLGAAPRRQGAALECMDRSSGRGMRRAGFCNAVMAGR
jgi:mannose-6-phosphate isomerase-like protein (cupin superfamily)